MDVKNLPKTPLQPNLQDWPFVPAEKRIKDKRKLECFLRSETCLQYEKFLTRTSKAVKTKKISDPVFISDFLQRLIDILDEMKEWLSEIPPISQPMRYGNKAFRIYMSRLEERSLDLMTRIFHDSLPQSGKEELSTYFVESFGNTIRIDYGTGHETNFVTFLFCLEILGFIGPKDYECLILRVFSSYINLMRHIQKTYMLEPAGSHGVWSLDDYQVDVFFFFFFPFCHFFFLKNMSEKISFNFDKPFSKKSFFLSILELLN